MWEFWQWFHEHFVKVVLNTCNDYEGGQLDFTTPLSGLCNNFCFKGIQNVAYEYEQSCLCCFRLKKIKDVPLGRMHSISLGHLGNV